MKYSLNVLNRYVDLKNLDIDYICQKLTQSAIEVESIELIDEINGLVVGKILECNKIEESDHLHFCKVDIGSKVLDIVCGASNCREGIKVICATVGAKLKDIVIKESIICKHQSNGMLCSLIELGIDKEFLDDNSTSLFGIEELDDKFIVGDTNIFEKLNLKDVILDLNILPNRSDLLSLFAMAYELSAIFNVEVKIPSLTYSANEIDSNFKIDSKSLSCSKLLVKVINNVKIQNSPKWLRNLLTSMNVKSINNLVDISNLVMLETGQPLHFYDLKSFDKQELIVKDDLDIEYTALDKNSYKLIKGDLVITSNNKAIGIAGIMGGENTKILEDTSSIVIESALFKQDVIRKTSNRLGLSTDASTRFSKGLEPLAQINAINRATSLLIELADATNIEKTVSFGDFGYKDNIVEESFTHLNSLIGKDFDRKNVIDILKRLKLNPEVSNDLIKCHIPSYRSNDLKLACDIDEEIVRLSDFSDLKPTLPYLKSTQGKLDEVQKMKRIIKSTLTSFGFFETLTYTLVDDFYTNKPLLNDSNTIKLAHPISDIRKNLRNNMLYSMLETLYYNVDRRNNDVNIFEISDIYDSNGFKSRLSVLSYGNIEESKLLNIVKHANFYTLKAILKSTFEKLGYLNIKVEENDIDDYHFNKYRSAKILIDSKVVGIIGQIHPSIITNNKVGDVYYFEVILDDIFASSKSKIELKEISKYPSVVQDLSFLVKDEVLSNDIISFVFEVGKDIVKDVEIVSIYKSLNIKEGYNSTTIKVKLESFDHTLTNQELNNIHDLLITSLNQKYSI